MMERVRRSLHSRPGVAVLIAVGILTPWSRCLAQATITVYAGTGNPGPIGDGGQARNAFLDGPESVALDSAGNLYIREHARVRKVTPAGVISTVAGNGTTGYSGDGGPGKDAKIGLGPQRAGLATDSAGNLYIADTNNYRVRKVDAAGIITTFAGNGQIGIGAPADGSQAKNVALCFPTGAAVDTQGNVYFGSSVCGGGVRKVDSAGIVTNVAKNAPGAPYGVALDTNGNLYLNQGGGPSVIRKVSTSGTVSVFAGNGTSGFSGDDGPATAAQLFEVDGVAVDSAGNVFIADSGNGRIRKVDTSGIITTVAGHGSVGPGAGCQNLFTTGCPATNLKFTPDDVAVDALGNLYTANFVSGLVYKISPNTSAPGCTYELSPGGLAFTAAGGNGTISVTAQQGCAWSVSGAPAWIINSTSGAGTATLTFQAAANSGSARTATVTIGGVSFAIEQAAASIPGAVLAGSLGQVTSQGGWDFTLDAINLGPSAATARFSFLNNAGGPLALPWTFPQTVGYPSTGSLLTDTLDRTLAPNAQLLLASTGPDTATNLVGSGQLSTNGNVIGFGIFSNHAYHWNAVVPLEARDSGRYILAFDNNDPLVTGVAVENLGAAANIAIIIRDDTGTQIGNPILSLPALGHASFMLNAQYPVTVNKRGTIEFVTPPSGRISSRVIGRWDHRRCYRSRYVQWRFHQCLLFGQHRIHGRGFYAELF